MIVIVVSVWKYIINVNKCIQCIQCIQCILLIYYIEFINIAKRLALMKKLSFKFIILDETTFFNMVRIRFKNNGFNTY